MRRTAVAVSVALALLASTASPATASDEGLDVAFEETVASEGWVAVRLRVEQDGTVLGLSRSFEGRVHGGSVHAIWIMDLSDGEYAGAELAWPGGYDLFVDTPATDPVYAERSAPSSDGGLDTAWDLEAGEYDVVFTHVTEARTDQRFSIHAVEGDVEFVSATRGTGATLFEAKDLTSSASVAGGASIAGAHAMIDASATASTTGRTFSWFHVAGSGASDIRVAGPQVTWGVSGLSAHGASILVTDAAPGDYTFSIDRSVRGGVETVVAITVGIEAPSSPPTAP